MARRKKRLLSPSPPSGGLQRSQMRDPLLDRSRLVARRSVRESLLSPRAIRNLITEDLRREKSHLALSFPAQTYRRDDGGQAHIVGREVDTHKMQFSRVPARLRYEFQDPRGTLVCQRRKARRAVIFALRKAGKAGRRNRKARWTAKSHIVCRKGR